jgi:hypothetical protein
MDPKRVRQVNQLLIAFMLIGIVGDDSDYCDDSAGLKIYCLYTDARST